MKIDVPHGDVRHTGFAVVSSEPTDADSMARSTIYAVDVNVRAAGLDGDAVIPCVLIRVSVTFPFGSSVKDSAVNIYIYIPQLRLAWWIMTSLEFCR